MLNLKIKSLVFLLALLLGCTGYVPPANYPNNQQVFNPNNFNNPNNPNNFNNFNNPNNFNNQNFASRSPRDEIDYIERNERRETARRETLRNARRGDSCEDENTNHECYDLCREMYKRSDDREECEELTPDNVDSIYVVWEALDRARLNDLEDIDSEHLDWFINVSIAGFDYLIRDYKKSDAQNVLQWIAEDEDVAEIMRDEDDDFETLEELLSILDTRFDFNTVEDPFTEYIDRKTLFEYAIFTGNSTAMDYFMDYFLQTHRSCRSNSSSVPCLTVVCEIGVAIDPRDREGLFDSDIFDDFIADIIDDKVNGADDTDGERWIKGTGPLKIDSTNDLDNSWANPEWDPEDGSKTICGGLVSE